jgi:hypothetical protein
VFGLTGIGLVASIFSLRIRPELVVPAAAIAAAANVFVFGLRLDRGKQKQPVATSGPALGSASAANPSLDFLRIAVVTLLSLGAFMLVKFGVDGWLGLGDPSMFWRFVPKFATFVAFSIYGLRKIRDREPF